MKTIALIVAAGRGRRLGGAIPKQYLSLAGHPILRHTIAAFQAHPAVEGICTVIHPDDRALYDHATAGLDLLAPVHGGASRQASVLRGLDHLAAWDPDLVLIHDAARPFVGPDVLDRVIDALSSHAGALPAIAVSDTLKRAGPDGLIGATVERHGLWRAQAPQGFRFAAIRAAHRDLAGQALTDDAAVAEIAGLDVVLVPGFETNFKITTPDDVKKAENMMQTRRTESRIGQGYDVHRFTDGDAVTLCGVALPHTAALAGHSDADVALHALTDALLGAIAEADIGAHFPPSDPQWRGAASTVFVAHALDLIAARAGRLRHIDLTIICEAPKISPHRTALRQSLAALTGLDLDRISVKGTTTEGLGFTGRREGIAAMASVVVELPIGNGDVGADLV